MELQPIQHLKDTQSEPDYRQIPIDRVGVKNLRYPIQIRDKARAMQSTVAQFTLAVDLPHQYKGTHMSRFVEALESWTGDLSYASFRELLSDVRGRLKAKDAHVTFRFPYFIKRKAPVSASPGVMDYQCSVEGRLDDAGFRISLGVEVPVMTVCPCSLAISGKSAHSQRAVVSLRCRFKGFLWLEELIDIAESSASSKVYAVLKRRDEKFVTEDAFENPAFVEDVVRAAADALNAHPLVTWYKAEAESFESIHNHSAFAAIERTK